MGTSDQTRIYHVTYAEQQQIGFLFFWGCNFQCRICLLKKEAFDCHLAENRLRIYEPSYVGAPPHRFLSVKGFEEILAPVALRQAFLIGPSPSAIPCVPGSSGTYGKKDTAQLPSLAMATLLLRFP